jgi:hypothetical protein
LELLLVQFPGKGARGIENCSFDERGGGFHRQRSLLKEAGHRILGLTMVGWDEQAAQKAAAAHGLGII